MPARANAAQAAGSFHQYGILNSTRIAGIIRIRIQVSVFGRFQCEWPSLPGVEVFINYLGETAPEAAYLCEIVDTGTQNPLQATELLQQLASLHRAQTRNGFEYRLTVAFRPLPPVSCDRKAMRLVAHALDQMQGMGVRGQQNRRVPARQVQLLLARAPVRALRDADQRDTADTELSKRLVGFGQLPFAAVDQQYIGSREFAVAHASVAPRQRLVHRGIVIARLDIRDIEAPVIALQRPLHAEHHAGSHRIGASGVTDVETFDAPRRLREAERPGQFLEARLDVGAGQSTHLQRLLG